MRGVRLRDFGNQWYGGGRFPHLSRAAVNGLPQQSASLED